MRKTSGGRHVRCWFHTFQVNTLSDAYESGQRSGVTRKRDPDEKKRKPEALGNVLGAFLKDSKLEERVEAAQVVPEWESLVGMQIASVTKPISVTPDGTLFVAVKTNGWMTELSLMEPQILRALNAKAGRTRVKKIRLQLMR
jgi:predicted nucleic acid-binding Zn ribbon protein